MNVWLIIRYDYEDCEVLGIATNKIIAKEIRDKDKANCPFYGDKCPYTWSITKHKVRMGGE